MLPVIKARMGALLLQVTNLQATLVIGKWSISTVAISSYK